MLVTAPVGSVLLLLLAPHVAHCTCLRASALPSCCTHACCASHMAGRGCLPHIGSNLILSETTSCAALPGAAPPPCPVRGRGPPGVVAGEQLRVETEVLSPALHAPAASAPAHTMRQFPAFCRLLPGLHRQCLLLCPPAAMLNHCKLSACGSSPSCASTCAILICRCSLPSLSSCLPALDESDAMLRAAQPRVHFNTCHGSPLLSCVCFLLPAVDESGTMLPVAVRVGQAVDTVAQVSLGLSIANTNVS